MNEPRYQFWRPIQPVEGQPIPEGAEYLRTGDPLGGWKRPWDSEFTEMYTRFEWRVPVEVVPIDVAADAITQNRAIITKGWRAPGQSLVYIEGEDFMADTLPQLRELVIAKLRQISQEKADDSEG